MFEWGGGCLWCGNDAARDRFGVGNIEDALPLSQETRDQLETLTEWHDTALDWDDPAGPSPWTPSERAAFEVAALKMRERIQAELGPDFQVTYKPL
jgi:hypothetical protein